MTEYVLEIDVPPELEEVVQARLFLTESRGSAVDELTISAYFDSAEARDVAAAALSDLPVALRAVERQHVDWLERYQQSLHAIEIGERFVVAPDPALLPPDGRRIAVVVPQEQAFGTGSHASTALCMALLETLEVGGARAIDIGAGSGILAIAAHHLGAAKVIAFDIDPDTYAALRENRARNGIDPERMPLFIGGPAALRGGVFDLVMMNILPDVILALLPDVLPRMSATSRLVVSGILEALSREFIEIAQSHGLSVVRERVRGEWWGAVLQRSR